MLGSDCDVIRVRASVGEDRDSVTLDVGVTLDQQSREMLLAAACAERAPQAVFRAAANKDAAEYLKSVRLGQTEQGSFVITLLAPPPPLLQPALDPAWDDLDAEPFSRRVSLRLVTALRAARSAAETTLYARV